MTAYQRSFAKTSITAAVTGLCVIVAIHLVVPGRFRAVTALIDAAGWVIGAILEAAALGGVIALYREGADLDPIAHEGPPAVGEASQPAPE